MLSSPQFRALFFPTPKVQGELVTSNVTFAKSQVFEDSLLLRPHSLLAEGTTEAAGWQEKSGWEFGVGTWDVGHWPAGWRLVFVSWMYELLHYTNNV